MGKILAFTRPQAEPGTRMPSGELPVLTAAERRRLQGSVEGATDAEVQRNAVAANPMRLLSRFLCRACAHQWQQPAATGCCPSCHSADVVLQAQVPCMAARV